MGLVAGQTSVPCVRGALGSDSGVRQRERSTSAGRKVVPAGQYRVRCRACGDQPRDWSTRLNAEVVNDVSRARGIRAARVGGAAHAELAPTSTLRVVFLGSDPVQGRVEPTTGALSGPVANLVPALAKRIGKPYRILPVTDAAAVMESIRSGQAALALLAIEAARGKQVDFSYPYMMMGSAYLVRAESPVQRSGGVDRPGVMVGAVRGQSQQVWGSANLKTAEMRMGPTVPAANKIVRLVVRRGDPGVCCESATHGRRGAGVGNAHGDIVAVLHERVRRRQNRRHFRIVRGVVAEREGFEPPGPFQSQRFSRPPP